jgi:hypothetical protein
MCSCLVLVLLMVMVTLLEHAQDRVLLRNVRRLGLDGLLGAPHLSREGGDGVGVGAAQLAALNVGDHLAEKVAANEDHQHRENDVVPVNHDALEGDDVVHGWELGEERCFAVAEPAAGSDADIRRRLFGLGKESEQTIEVVLW